MQTLKTFSIAALLAAALLMSTSGCNKAPTEQSAETAADTLSGTERLDIYATVKLSTDLSQLTEDEKQVLPYLIEAAQIMDALFWKQAWGNKDSLLSRIPNERVRKFAEANYGPWDRLKGDEPFINGMGPKPLGAQFYPADMTREELENSNLPDAKGAYSLVRRDANGKLYTIPYHEAYEQELKQAAELLRKASGITKNAAFSRYLQLRADALLSSQYLTSDEAWLDMKDNGIDLIIGPIENYEDKLFNYRTAFESYVLVKDKAWSKRLERYVQFLPELQKTLPVAAKYKAESPGSDAQLNAYDVVYYAGDCNAGSKTIAVNLPNDEGLQQSKGTRRSQLKNAMKAKFDQIMLPIAAELMVPEQQKHVTFDAFFANTMFHEVAHGLGIKNTITGKGSVRESLQELFSALEEGKADILGLYMVTQLYEKGELKEGSLEDYYITFMAGIFRSVRFGASSAHGQANMLRFNYFERAGAFTRTPEGRYEVNMKAMRQAMNDLSALILQLQGDGDKGKVQKLFDEMGGIKPQLQQDLDRLSSKGIPVDVIFEQGLSVLGL